MFGPENGAMSERLVQEGAKKAALKNYTHLYVIGFAIQPNARHLIENCDAVLKKALRGEYEEGVWDHLAGTTSAPFEAGEHRQIAVKVIDDRGNELMVVEKLAEAV